MILSRHFAKRRIQAGVRPSWLAAWGLVLADGLILLPVILGLGFLVSRYFFMIRPTHWGVMWSLVVTVFLPMQVVLITSSIWASKSRWQDRPEKEDM